jgi:hypothetical protein
LLAGRESAGVCVPVEAGGSVTIAIDVLTLAPRQTVQVTKAELMDARSLVAGAVSIVPLSGTNYVGTHSRYPPLASDLTAAGLDEDWSARSPLPTGPLVADEEPRQLNLVLELRPTAAVATASAVELTYRTPDGDGSVLTPTALKVVTNPNTC